MKFNLNPTTRANGDIARRLIAREEDEKEEDEKEREREREREKRMKRKRSL